ncbi:hypothetical protein [Thauera butanivorans]|uniref:hypothetical protein n=1 Tax=Thauera butanivorans TaxID=86174 RepID=UPI000AD5E758|nr:hypothetical protein [Thauera butanivorans]
MLQQTETITARALRQASDKTPPSCELVVGGKPTGQRIEGCVLEAALECDAGYLLFLTDDIPHEDSLNIHLVSFSGTLEDSARIGGMYSTGRFEKLQVQQPDKISFRFMGDTIWTLQVLQKPAFRIPFLSEPAGVHRPPGSKRRFLITGSPRWEAHSSHHGRIHFP